jgi:hypothetical protein
MAATSFLIRFASLRPARGLDTRPMALEIPGLIGQQPGGESSTDSLLCAPALSYGLPSKSISNR